MKKGYSYYLSLVMLCLLSFTASAQITFTETYTSTQGNATAAQLANWNNFRSLLVPLPYSKLRVTGITGSVVYSDSCTNPVIVQDMAMRLRTITSATPYTWVDGAKTWYIGLCGTGPELSLNQTTCACNFTNGRSVRGGCTTCFNNNGEWGPFPDCGNPTVTLIVEFFYGYPCTSTPTANVVAQTPVCAGKPFSVDIDKFYADATYTWEYSDDGVTWKPHPAVVGAYSAAISDAIFATRWYRCNIVCNANTSLNYTTAPFRIDIAPFYYCYCDNGTATTPGLDIGNITIIRKNTQDTVLNNGNSTPLLSNTSAKNSYTNYQYPPNKPVVMYRDSTYRTFVTQINSNATATNGNVAIFIDIDRNGTFDFGERLYSAVINGGNLIPQTSDDFIKIPSTAKVGMTGMRVIVSTANIDSCGFGMAQGEVEDYIVDMRYEPCKGPANPGIVSSTSTSLCSGYDYVTSNTGYEAFKSDIDRTWMVSADNIVWFNVANSLSKDTLMRVFSGQPLYYKTRSICTATKDTTYAPVLKVDAKAGYKCYCFSQAIGGNPKNSLNPKDSSDIGGIEFSTFNTNSGGSHLLNNAAQEKRTDYTDDTPILLDIDSTYSLTVYHTQRTAIHADAKITVFIDYNNDKEYDFPEERVYTGFTNVGQFTVVDNITIPNKAITGVPTGMRVILNNEVGPNKPSDEACGPYTSGETEDLMVMFNRKFPAGIKGTAGINDLGVYPNPAKDKCKLQFSGAYNAKEVTVTITSITGQKLMQETYNHDGGTFTKELDVAKYTRGVYFVEVAADGIKSTQKLVLE
eukprot:TRINITY_DN21793_c0_g1_i1.p1 TRINITY_DN21793_c0_g1~~TRINITY_DN21793_c0_g1_i1.p1  ORF type:complete len:800 (+),score=68.82 TRINITY_DN21793_c0_g1_i1:61-2460(+)